MQVLCNSLCAPRPAVFNAQFQTTPNLALNFWKQGQCPVCIGALCPDGIDAGSSGTELAFAACIGVAEPCPQLGLLFWFLECLLLLPHWA
eukprot:1149325-Pelagomonas_calceolata.AAC.11